ncbi:MAG: transposase [Planctomycetia bacterium]|nr:transposase [Planctomycetia bacterium]
MPQFLSRNRRLTLEMLPPWAPELNPVEPIWSWLKYGELANFVPDETDVLNKEVLNRLIGLKFDPELLQALWERSGLNFTPMLGFSPDGHRLTLYHEGGEYVWDATPRPEPKK